MDTTKSFFIKQVNKHGIISVRERNPDDDLTGYGALEFVLNNGEVFVISGYQFGQGGGEDGLWVDMNAYSPEDLVKLKEKLKSEKATQKGLNKTEKIVEFEDEYLDDIYFEEFVFLKFDFAAQDAPLEKIAKFAFGSVEESIKAFERENKNGE